uniref:ABC transporter domain-containing protein n=1 Tax=Nelumbo nucifera TaxID=4432 RepID=A0A822Z8V3_NELNU|nr:TPA_asm: hypothetical protein HUJ06_000994 [Nelumbo nucifera]
MASCFQKTGLDDDQEILYSTTSNSPQESTSPSSSFYNSSSSSHRSYPHYKLTVKNLSYTKSFAPSSFCFLTRRIEHINILRSVSFTARSSEILAVVGPSGAGKSTLLQIISGRIRHTEFDPKSLSLNDQPITSPSQLRRMCGFVAQEDNLLPLLTVKETLMFSAKFRLRGMNSKEKKERVECLMHELGLLHVADSFIGDEETRGISGGERKRVSIGVDMIHDPPILLLDEPTSGLDSTSALQAIPKFLLLSRGSVIHNGSLELLEVIITHMGYKIPVQLNALEYAMEIVRPLEDSISKGYISAKEEKQPSSFSIWPGEIKVQQTVYKRQTCCCYFWRLFEILSLCLRFWKVIYRTKQLFLARTMQAIVGGLGLGSVYLRVKKDDSGVAERLGLFAFSLSFLLSSTVEALPIFLQERRVLMKEASRGAYKVSSYMIANTIIFVPFLFVVAILFAIPVYWLVGLNPSFNAFAFFVFIVWLIVLMASSLVLFLSAVSPDFISGNSLISTILGAFFLFSGYFIPKENIPKYWLFMYYVSLYKYPLDSLLINEYWSMRDTCFSWKIPDGSICTVTGRDVLKSRGLDQDTRWMNVGIMIGFFLFYRLLCWIILARRASKTML